MGPSTLVLVSLLRPVVDAVPLAAYTIEARFPHRSDCFTEGLVLNGSEVLESCGLTGKSVLRRYDLSSGQTKKEVRLDHKYFGEGTVELNGSLFVLTYQHREMLEYDSKTLQVKRAHPFPYGEGWGLTTDGCDLIATTGSSYLFRLRRAQDGEFKLVSKVLVKHDGKSLHMLNEVEYITPKLWVNEWITNRIWRVDPMTGNCEKTIDIGQLHPWQGQATPNGIAYSTAFGKDALLVTGKLWPQMFSLRMTALDLCGGSQPLPDGHCANAPPSLCHDPPPARPGASTAPAAAAAITEKVTRPALVKGFTMPTTPHPSIPKAVLPEKQGVASAVSMGLFSRTPVVPVPSLPFGFSAALSLLGACMFLAALASGLLIRYMRRRQRDTLHRQVESESDGG